MAVTAKNALPPLILQHGSPRWLICLIFLLMSSGKEFEAREKCDVFLTFSSVLKRRAIMLARGAFASNWSS